MSQEENRELYTFLCNEEAGVFGFGGVVVVVVWVLELYFQKCCLCLFLKIISDVVTGEVVLSGDEKHIVSPEKRLVSMSA